MTEREKAKEVARLFHENYRALAPMYGWRSAVTQTPWPELPHANRNLMVATAQRLLEQGVIRP